MIAKTEKTVYEFVAKNRFKFYAIIFFSLFALFLTQAPLVQLYVKRSFVYFVAFSLSFYLLASAPMIALGATLVVLGILPILLITNISLAQALANFFVLLLAVFLFKKKKNKLE